MDEEDDKGLAARFVSGFLVGLGTGLGWATVAAFAYVIYAAWRSL